MVIHLDQRNFKSFLNKIKFIAFESSIYLSKINIHAAKENNYIKLENNFIFKNFFKNKFIFSLVCIIEELFIFLDKKFIYLPFIYKIAIAFAYFQGCHLKIQKNKRLRNLQNWYK